MIKGVPDCFNRFWHTLNRCINYSWCKTVALSIWLVVIVAHIGSLKVEVLRVGVEGSTVALLR